MSGIKEKISSLSKTDQKYLDRALALAALSDMKQRHGALIVKGGRVVSFGFNTFRNLPHHDMPGFDYTYHAEDSALRQVGPADLNGAKIYVARLSRLGLPALSRPCDNCMAHILKVGIKEVIYTVS